MKKIIIVINAVLIVFLAACSVQEKVSPDIFVERLSAANDSFVFETESCFIDGNKAVFFAKYNNEIDTVFEITEDEQGNAEKISLACTQADKAELFISCVKNVIETYSPDDNSDEILTALFEKIINDGKNKYYETQWHSYSAVFSKEGLFFSVKNKKLIKESSVEFSLKENDIIEYE